MNTQLAIAIHIDENNNCQMLNLIPFATNKINKDSEKCLVNVAGFPYNLVKTRILKRMETDQGLILFTMIGEINITDIQ